jgi:hypothetical protein
MNRALYRCLISLHPRAFRERFGDEMLCVFDEATHTGATPFVADAFASLARQWLFRSGIWKMAVGAAFSAIFLCSWAYSEASWEKVQAVRAAAMIKPAPPLDRAQFNRDTAAAIAMLARFRETGKKKSHSHNSSKSIDAAPSNSASPD